MRFIEEASKTLSICFIKVKDHSNESIYNDLADKAAKKALVYLLKLPVYRIRGLRYVNFKDEDELCEALIWRYCRDNADYKEKAKYNVDNDNENGEWSGNKVYKNHKKILENIII